MFRTGINWWRYCATLAPGIRALAAVTVAGLMVAGSHAIDAQDQSGKPVLSIAGPQGIGLRVQPIAADAARFEAASIRLDKSGTMPPSSQGQQVFFRGNRLTATTITVRELIRNGYNLQHVPRSFVVDGPDWIDSERWNLEAVAAMPFEPQRVRNVPPPDAAAMLRAMLVDRLNLKVHNEMREKEVYELVLDRADGKLGPGIKPSTDDCIGAFETDSNNKSVVPTPDGRPTLCGFGYSYAATSRMFARHLSMKHIAMFFGLVASINMGVIDRTGVDGRFDVDFQFAGDVVLSPNAAPVPREVGATDIPTLPGAIRQQLGLRLQKTRAMVEVLVIDHVERPTEN
jgi:uncharacterized protein (TIGR03435 family)